MGRTRSAVDVMVMGDILRSRLDRGLVAALEFVAAVAFCLGLWAVILDAAPAPEYGGGVQVLAGGSAENAAQLVLARPDEP